MIRNTLTTDDTIASDIAFLEQQAEHAFRVAQETANEIRPSVLAELGKEPPKRSYPADYPNGQLPFDTEKQRRWYWANIGEPYKRKGTLSKAWQMYVLTDDSGFRLVIENTAPSAKWVYGSLAQNRDAARRFQQRFHAATGWQTATDTVTKWLDYYDAIFVEKMDFLFDTHYKTKRRAYTVGTKKR